MFTVVTLIEHQQFRVLTVPTSWIKDGVLMWPTKLPNNKINKMRREGTEYHGSVKSIPIIINSKFRNFKSAEVEADIILKSESLKKNSNNERSEYPEREKKYNTICQDIINSRGPKSCLLQHNIYSSSQEPLSTINHEEIASDLPGTSKMTEASQQITSFFNNESFCKSSLTPPSSKSFQQNDSSFKSAVEYTPIGFPVSSASSYECPDSG
ncbi:uncharacterized protein LOC129762208 isoform X3 [Toxorhynchites rutilus septentrionalis]|uniref:uncharacterized protein LOC129762208 isoform X3 n=1 Tax=Toxorhynchites rutilus septentrionalis TaxID=329112 RepID=UPI00247A1E3D|nr:uncharacterized protein LOC129762208 isoform X3 [Toxorhynchites rutilus septentrionalis]